jgi:lipoate-protein ligase A
VTNGFLAGTWRLLEEGPQDGVANMAEDVALLEGDGPLPVLRLYAWARPTLSLGYSQDARTVVDWEGVRELGVDVVRRPTGGGAVLHEPELEVTYSVVAPAAFLPSGIVESYRVLAEALAQALRLLGGQVQLAPTVPPLQGRSPACFETPTQYELLLGGRKAVGSAQCRRGGRILQHGAIPLSLRPQRTARVLRGLGQGLEEHAWGLREALGRPVTAQAVRWAVREAVGQVLGARLVPGELTPAEERRKEHHMASGAWGPFRPQGEEAWSPGPVAAPGG